MDSDSARVLDKDGKGITSTDMGGGHTGLDVNAVIDLEGATVEVGEVDQGVAGLDPWAVEFLTPQHVVVDSGGAVGLTDAELRATPVPISGDVTTDVDTSLLAQESGGVLDDILTELGAKTEPANTQITVGPPDLVSSPFLIDALNETGEVAVAGYYGVSVTLSYVAFSGTVGFNISGNAGANYAATYVVTSAGQLVAEVVGGGSTTVSTYTFPMAGGNSHVQVKATAFTSGSVTAVFRNTASFVTGLPATGLSSGSVIPTTMQVGGYWADVINLITPIRIRTGTQLSTDGGVVTKPVNVAAAPLFVQGVKSATPTVAQIADSATNVTLLASSAGRLGAYIYNDSSAVLRLKLGATASATSFSILLQGNASGVGGYYEVPGNYTGIIDGIWASAPGGFAYVTSLAI